MKLVYMFDIHVKYPGLLFRLGILVCYFVLLFQIAMFVFVILT